MTPVYCTVQEGLSMMSCRKDITKSKHVFYIYISVYISVYIYIYIYIYI